MIKKLSCLSAEMKNVLKTLLAASIFVIFASCGGGEGEWKSGGGYDSESRPEKAFIGLEISLKENSLRKVSAGERENLEKIDCGASGIEKISVRITRAGEKDLNFGPFDCSLGEATISNGLTPGVVTLTLEGLNTSRKMIYKGVGKDLTLNPGYNPVVIEMAPATPMVSNSAAVITEFSLGGVQGVIDEASKSISVTLPAGTDIAALFATFSTTGKTVDVGGSVQASGVTSNDFTNPLIYRVTAADGSTLDYTVKVTLGVPSTISIKLTLTGDGVGGIDPMVTAAGFQCTALEGSCTTSVSSGTIVQFKPSPPAWSKFNKWVNCPQIVGDFCSFTATVDTTISANFTAITNIIFITEQTFTGAFGGMAFADSVCNSEASAASLPGRYVAWLSDGLVLPDFNYTAMIAATGWILVDGRMVANTVSDLQNGLIRHHISLTAKGELSTHNSQSVWSNINETGAIKYTEAANTCNGYTSEDPSLRGARGIWTTVGTSWSSGGTSTCNSQHSFYCVGVNHSRPIQAPGSSKDDFLFFLSKNTWTPSVAGGREPADQLCALEATEAGLNGTYRAYIGNSTEIAGARIDPNHTYVRPDGFEIVSTSKLKEAGQMPLLAPPNMRADGTFDTGNSWVWTGPGAALSQHCDNWKYTSADQPRGYAGRSIDFSAWRNNAVPRCYSAKHLYCFREL